MPSEKRQRQDQGRLLRLEEERQAQHSARRRGTTRNLVGAVIAVAVVGLVWALVSGDGDDAVETGSTTTLAPVETTTTFPSEPGNPAVGTTACPPADGTAERTTTFESGPTKCIDVDKTYVATVETSKGTFTMDLDPKAAPKAVNNFVFLARNHFYDGVTFHRIIPGFVVQGGDANDTPPGSGDAGYEFADELPTGDAPYYAVGDVVMANGGPNTNGSQFFVVTGDQGVNLPPDYTSFGRVDEGMDVIRAIEATGGQDGTPTEPTTITELTIAES